MNVPCIHGTLGVCRDCINGRIDASAAENKRMDASYFHGYEAGWRKAFELMIGFCSKNGRGPRAVQPDDKPRL